MMARHLLAACLLAGALVLVGCGGNEVAPVSPAPGPPAGGGGSSAHQVGPLVIRTASAAGFVAEEIPVQDGISLVALHGSTINYLASQAMLDRIVFSSMRDGGSGGDIWVCDLDGSNAVQLTANNANEDAPCWSPDGTQIAFERLWSLQDYEIILINADGSGIHALTTNTEHDMYPSFGPVGRRIAFASLRDGDYEIYTMFRDGSAQTNITNNGAADLYPDWSPQFTDPTILFCSTRDVSHYEIYEMNPDGTSVGRRTFTPGTEYYPNHSPQGDRMAFEYTHDVFVGGISYGTPYSFSASPGVQTRPSWSSDGRFICYVSLATGDCDLVLQETDEPYGKFALTHNTVVDDSPHLGSPTMQADRVLIGPAGSDWGGNDPVWASAYAGIVAFDGDGYRSFVRIGIRAIDVDTLDISPLSRPAINGGPAGPAGVAVEAAKIVNLREDAGRGLEPKVWDLDPLGATAVILYFDPYSGKLISVLALDDATYPSAVGSPGAGVTRRVEGDRLIVEGHFSAVFDADGRNVAPDGTARVTLDADGSITVLD